MEDLVTELIETTNKKGERVLHLFTFQTPILFIFFINKIDIQTS
jgi:hypothetical protein